MANLTGNEKYGYKNVTGLHNLYIDEFESETGKCDQFTFTTSLHGVDPMTFSYIQNLTSDVQQQINTTNTSLYSVSCLLDTTNTSLYNVSCLLDTTNTNVYNVTRLRI